MFKKNDVARIDVRKWSTRCIKNIQPQKNISLNVLDIRIVKMGHIVVLYTSTIHTPSVIKPSWGQIIRIKFRKNTGLTRLKPIYAQKFLQDRPPQHVAA